VSEYPHRHAIKSWLYIGLCDYLSAGTAPEFDFSDRADGSGHTNFVPIQKK
jgi:hypothetical protein